MNGARPSLGDWHAMPVTDALGVLETDLDAGLRTPEALRRLQLAGPNLVADQPDTPLWRLALGQFRSIVVILLLAASVTAYILNERLEAIAILAALLLNAAVGFVSEWRARRSLARLRALAVPSAVVRRDGRVTPAASRRDRPW